MKTERKVLSVFTAMLFLAIVARLTDARYGRTLLGEGLTTEQIGVIVDENNPLVTVLMYDVDGAMLADCHFEWLDNEDGRFAASMRAVDRSNLTEYTNTFLVPEHVMQQMSTPKRSCNGTMVKFAFKHPQGVSLERYADSGLM